MIAPSFASQAVRAALIFGAMIGIARADLSFSTDFGAQDVGASPYPAYNPGTLGSATVLVQPDPVTNSRGLDFTSQTAVDFPIGTAPGSSDLTTATAWYNYINSFATSDNPELNAYYQNLAYSYYYSYMGDPQHAFIYSNVAYYHYYLSAGDVAGANAILNQADTYYASLSFTGLTDFTYAIYDGSNELMAFTFDHLGNIKVGDTLVGSYSANSSYLLEYNFTPLVGSYTAQVLTASGLVGTGVTGSVVASAVLPGDLGTLKASNSGSAPVYLDNFGLVAVPEPSTVALALAGVIATGAMVRRRKG